MNYTFYFRIVLQNAIFLGGVLLTLRVMAISFCLPFSSVSLSEPSAYQNADGSQCPAAAYVKCKEILALPCPIDLDLLLPSTLYRNRYRSDDRLHHCPGHQCRRLYGGRLSSRNSVRGQRTD